MRFESVHSVQADPYRAGAETGEALRSIAPEVILLFASITYERSFADLFEGMRDGGWSSAVVISCAGRKWLLEDRNEEEVRQVLSTLGRKIPLVGFPSFGEISPIRKPDGTYTNTFFHNVTFVICAFGDQP